MIKEEGKVRAMKRGIGAYISAILIILNGVICIVNHQQIYKWIPVPFLYRSPVCHWPNEESQHNIFPESLLLSPVA